MVEERISDEQSQMLGKNAQRNNILAARVMSETVQTTLGPKGMDKMLVDRAGGVVVTNDGVTILSEMEIEHPAAKMIVEIAKTQEAEVGDGTTTAVMLAGKLLENAEKLLGSKIHPTIITKGYRLASKAAGEFLQESSLEINSEEELLKVATTAMTGKAAEHLKDQFGKIIVEAIKILSKDSFNIKDIKIEKKSGKSLEDTKLVSGIILDERRTSLDMPRSVNQAKIALIEEALQVRNPETEARISVSSPEQLQAFLHQEDAELKRKIEEIKASGATVLFVQRGLDDMISHYLAKEGIYAVRRVSKSDMQAISRATGASIVSRLKELTSADLGFANLVEEEQEGEDAMTLITGCRDPKALSILIRGSSNHVISEVERAFKDALGDVSATLKDSKVVSGGGAIEMELSKRIRDFAKTISGRKRLAVEEFASALEYIPQTLAENAGLDALDVLTELRASHDAGNKNAGLNLFTEKIEDTSAAGILEPLRVKSQAITSASEVAIMILRIDDVIAAKSNESNLGNPNSMHMYE